MNLISNNCVGTSLNHIRGLKYPNQFQWGGFEVDDFVFLANNYETIDYMKTEFGFENRLYKDVESVWCDIDGKIRYHFSHYMFDEEMEYPGCLNKKGYRYALYYKDPIGYARDCYYRRLSRNNEEPLFLYAFNLIDKADESYMGRIDKLLTVTKPLIVVIHENVELGDRIISDNLKIIRLPDDVMTRKAGDTARALNELI